MQKKKGVSDIFWRLEIAMIEQLSFIKRIIIKTLVKEKITIDYLKREDGLIFTKHMNLSSLESISRFSLFLRKMLNFNRG